MGPGLGVLGAEVLVSGVLVSEAASRLGSGIETAEGGLLSVPCKSGLHSEFKITEIPRKMHF